MMTSASSNKLDSNLTVTNELFQELLTKYDTLQENFKILGLKNKEYKKDIEQLKEQNAQLTIDINTHKEMEKSQLPKSYLLSALSSVDDIHCNNLDLNAQIKEYKNCIKQLKSENVQLKNENEKFRIALENANESKQKREEIYADNQLILQNKNKELQQEIDALNHEIACIFTIRKKSSTASTHFFAGYDAVTSPKTPAFRIRSLHHGTTHERFSSLMSNGTSTGLSASPAPLAVIESQNSIDDDYRFCAANSIHLDDEHQELLAKKASLSLGLIQSTTLECDKDVVTTIDENEELSQLKEIKDCQDELIKGLNEEIKLLRRRNGELLQKLDDNCVCSLLSMFK